MMKFLKDLGAMFLIFSTVFAILFMMMLASDAEYEVNQEREKIYFDRVEELKYENIK